MLNIHREQESAREGPTQSTNREYAPNQIHIYEESNSQGVNDYGYKNGQPDVITTPTISYIGNDYP